MCTLTSMHRPAEGSNSSSMPGYSYNVNQYILALPASHRSPRLAQGYLCSYRHQRQERGSAPTAETATAGSDGGTASAGEPAGGSAGGATHRRCNRSPAPTNIFYLSKEKQFLQTCVPALQHHGVRGVPAHHHSAHHPWQEARSLKLCTCIVVVLVSLVGAYAAGSCRESDTTA